MPELEALAPLRALLVSIARPDEATVWSSSGPISPWEARRPPGRAASPHAAGVSPHHRAPAGALQGYVEALEGQQRGDAPGVVAALLRAGRLEEGCGPAHPGAHLVEVALGVAEALQDRRPEVRRCARWATFVSRW